jgi:hypothetical protein
MYSGRNPVAHVLRDTITRKLFGCHLKTLYFVEPHQRHFSIYVVSTRVDTQAGSKLFRILCTTVYFMYEISYISKVLYKQLFQVILKLYWRFSIQISRESTEFTFSLEICIHMELTIAQNDR